MGDSGGGVNQAGGSQLPVLVIEDSIQLREILTEFLTQLGYSFAAVGSCAEGREAMKSGRFACCLIDLGLPDGHGLDLLQDFSSMDPQMVSVVLTGDSAAETVIDTMRSGAFDYLIKPLDIVTLRLSMNRAMAHHSALRERSILVDLLQDERDLLKERINEATADVVAGAKETEAVNALLHSFIRLTRLSSSFHTDEALLRGVYAEVGKHVPVCCIALCDAVQKELLCIVDDGDREASFIYETAVSAMGSDPTLLVADPERFVSTWVKRFAGLDVSACETQAYPQSLSERHVCTAGFFFEAGYSLTFAETEFLKMCSHYMAIEWQRSRLLLHAAHQASLGNIATELAKSSLRSLTAMRTAGDFVRETDSAEEKEEGLSIIVKNAEILTSLTQAFYNLSEARKDSIETVRLDEYINHTLRLLENSINSRALSIVRNFEVEGECLLLNGNALARTFLDLISNAIRATEDGGEIRLRLLDGGPEFLRCEISHGCYGSWPASDLGNDCAQSPLDVAKSHPSFLLAQRTVQSCGGRLTLEPEGETANSFRIVLPKDSLSSASTEASSR